MQQCTPVSNFSLFGELQILGPNLLKKMIDKKFEKTNIKIEISIQESTSVSNFSQFEKLQIWGPDLSKKYE